MIFADTGPFVARYGKGDQYHRDAERLWPTLTRPVLTSSHVVSEFATILGRRVGLRQAAERVKEELYASESIEIVQSTREDELEALNWMRKYADHRIGFTDCLSFAMMRRHGIRTAFTFDRHFRDAGFEVIGVK